MTQLKKFIRTLNIMMFFVLVFPQNFMEVPEGKKDHIDDISEQAMMLKKEDAQNKNGTTDVESRWVLLEGSSLWICVWLKLQCHNVLVK